MKIALVVVYFGPWPPWFPAFVHSCRFNPHVDWYFFSDTTPPSHGAPNLKFIHLSMTEFNTAAGAVLGVPVSMSHPRKVCDFRPAYGHLFETYLVGYDFWGHCDLDVVWGDLGRFVTEEILRSHSVVSARKHVMCGHFSLYANEPHLNLLYKRIPDYLTLLASPELHAVDEDHMSELVRESAAHGELRVYWPKFLLNFANPTTDTPGMLEPIVNGWLWRRGSLFNLTEGTLDEVMYLHFMTWKTTLRTCEFGFDAQPDAFYISYSHISLAHDAVHP